MVYDEDGNFKQLRTIDDSLAGDFHRDIIEWQEGVLLWGEKMSKWKRWDKVESLIKEDKYKGLTEQERNNILHLYKPTKND